MSASGLGQLAAVGTALCWTFSSLAFESAGRKLGSLNLNLIRLVIAFVFLTLHGFAFGAGIWPETTVVAWQWLSLSALVGMLAGDYCLFRALIEIGPRRALLVMSSAPIWTALLGTLVFAESISPARVFAMFMIVCGIALVVLDRPARVSTSSPEWTPKRVTRGYAFALGGALGQAGGLILSKIGLESGGPAGIDPFAATQIRVLAATLGFLVIIVAGGRTRHLFAVLRERQSIQWAAVGAFFGPYVGVALSLFAVHAVHPGIAAALMAITPILMLPIAAFRGERVGWRGACGAFVAVAGVWLLVRPTTSGLG